MSMSAARLTPVLAALALAGCATAVTSPPVAMTAPTALDTWASRVELQAEPEEIRLAAHDAGLSGNQARALADFHARWLQAEGGVITIAAPSNSGQPAGSYRVSADARTFLVTQGASPDQVRLIGYDAGGDPLAPVIVGFDRYVAVTPVCGGWRAATSTFTNEPQDGFGCAVSANMAAQVANPEDLARARAMTPADPGRRSVVFGKYRQGAATSTAKDEQASGAVSQSIR
ncbi:MAG: CpaD family pilus assembly protein [Pseudomonadota bacterium]